MKKHFFIIILMTFSLLGLSQDTEIWIKNSPEIRLNIVNTPIEIRWRPIDQMIMPDHYFGKHSLIRTDLMLGVNIWKFKLFSYSKYDEFDRFYTGARLDLNLDFLDKKLLLNLQGRYFFGLNEDSKNHYYQVEYLRYAVTPKIRLGILSYGKYKTEKKFKEGEWFVGPSANFILPYNFNFMTVFARNILPNQNNIYMFFVRVGYRIKLDLSKTDKEI